MNRRPFSIVSEFFLDHYRSADFIRQQKVIILSRTCLIILGLVLPVYLISSILLDWSLSLQAPLVLFAFILIVILLLLKAGHYMVAAHSFMILSLATIWYFFFNTLGDNPHDYLERMFSVVLVLGILTFTPLIVDRMKHVIIFYYTSNVIVYIIFVLVIRQRVQMQSSTMISYFVDCLIAFVMSGIIAYQIFRINNTALESAQSAEVEIRKSEELFRGVVEESPQVMIILTPDGALEFLGNAKVTAFGYSIEDIPVLERWWEKAYPDAEYRDVIKSEWSLMVSSAESGKSVQSIETMVTARDGTAHDAMIRYTSLGTSGRGLILLDDITNRKIIERSLRASERRYRKLYESMLDGFVSLDMSGKILEFNNAYQEITGYTGQELYSMTVWDLTPDRWHHIQKNIIEEQVLTRGHSEIFEKEYIRKDGTMVPIELRIYLILDERGAMTGMWSIVHDITKRKQAENELLKASKIESLGIFAGGIAHDFNNLLTAIMGNISIAKLDGDISSDTRMILAEAETASDRARDLTMQLLTFSRGGTPIKKVASIRDLLVGTVDFVLRGSTIKSSFSIPGDAWNAEFDEGQISQVIHNLTLNAREAMPGGGIISVSVENRVIESGENLPFLPGDYLVIKLTDSGYGIPKKNLHKIFDPFFTTKTNGNGLGLSVTYSIVKKHNGYITVESEEGAGTCFSVFLPATEKRPLSQEGRPGTGVMRGGKALIMDDEEMVLEVGRRILNRLGFTDACARNGREAIDLYMAAKDSGAPFDFVIMDLTVPGGMGGKEAIRILREYDPGVKAIVSSGYSIDPVMANYGEFGFSGMVAKPYTFEDLQKAIRSIQA
jgi:PAS domain S-box-containing protein